MVKILGDATTGRGHCHYSARANTAECAAPAVLHVWLGPADAPLGTTYACEQHAALVHRMPEATDWHEMGDACLLGPVARWRFTDLERIGWCFSPDEERVEIVELAESVA